MRLIPAKNSPDGFSLADCCLAIGVVAIFGMAAFAANQRLLAAAKSQAETVAATMAMQWRMETFRKTGFSDIGSAGTATDYVMTNILTLRNPKDPNGNIIRDVDGNPIDPFAGMGSQSTSFEERFTISPFLSDGSLGNPTTLSWDRNHPSGRYIGTPNANLLNDASDSGMLKVDVLEIWAGTNGRSRQRQLSTIVTRGNIAP